MKESEMPSLREILERIEQGRDPVHIFNTSLNPAYRRDRLSALTPPLNTFISQPGMKETICEKHL
jgi:hypothetical protein